MGPLVFLEDGVGALGPHERLGRAVALAQIALDGGLEIGNGAENAAAQAFIGQFGEQPLDQIKPEAEVGVKCMGKRGCRASQRRTCGCLWVW